MCWLQGAVCALHDCLNLIFLGGVFSKCVQNRTDIGKEPVTNIIKRKELR